MYILTLQRKREFKNVAFKGKVEDATLGEVSLKDEQGSELWSGFSCENIGTSTDKSGQDKRIIAREYDLEWTKTSTNGNAALGKWRNKALLLTCDSILPNFRNRRILIHAGNAPQDTEGCLLFGKGKGEGIVTNSVAAIIELFDIVERIGAENIKLVVKEIQ